MNKITGVEPIEIKLDVMQARFVARSMANLEAMEGLWPADFEGSEEDTAQVPPYPLRVHTLYGF